MKKNVLLIVALMGTTIALAQVPKIPLVEHFTQASCGPCASQNPAMKVTLDNFGTANYVRISHQVSWPGVDPMNANFPAGPNDRRTYYGITGVPNTVLNGGAPGAPNTIVTSSTLATAAALMTPYQITATQSWANANSVTVNINVQNVTGAPISSADKIFVTMLENTVTWPTPPGSNGETSFEYVMREMYNATTGAPGATSGAALGTIAANATQNFNFTLTSLPAYLRDKSEVSFAIYIQNATSKTIHQAGKTSLVSIPGLINVGAVSATLLGSGYCDYGVTPKVTFTNNDAGTAVTSVVAQYSLNGGAAVQQTFTGNLSQGQSTTISFPATTLTPGTSTLNYTIVSVNGGQDWTSPAAVAINQEVYNKLNSAGVAAPVFEGMENAVLETGTGYSRSLTTGLFDSPTTVTGSLFGVLDGPTYNYGAVGGFASSNRSIRFRYFSIASGAKLNFVMQKINLGANSMLTFDHTYRQYASENDKLEVFVSTDCGATWTSVFSKAGSALATLAPSTTTYVPAAAADWATNTVSLAAYNNTSDVIVRFEGTSDYGNNMYLDNINIGSLASVNELNADNFSIFPNPATEKVNIAFEAQNGTYEISLVDLTGRVLTTKSLSNVNGSQVVEIPVDNIATGNYLVSIQKDGVKFTQKVTVQ
jgi:hypothetical protein